MQPQRHPQILNTAQTASEESLFPLFPLLPPELRLKVWHFSLQNLRLIRVQLEDVLGFSTPIVDDPPCLISLLNGDRVFSKLLRVNHESRMATLKFYRVHFPCWMRERPITGGRRTLGTLYFNPEYDTLWVCSRTARATALVELVYHLKHTYDPHNVGLLHLAMEISTIKVSDSRFLRPSGVGVKLEEAFVETLKQLHEVIFVAAVETGCNVVNYEDRTELYGCMPKRSLPIMAAVPKFQRVRDPRSIAMDLKRVYLGTDPLTMLCFWQKLLRIWDISPVQVRYQFMLTLDPPLIQTPVHSQKTAKQWLCEEERIEEKRYGYEKYLDNILLDFSEIGEACKNRPREKNIEKAIRPAFGFWLFSMEAFGKLPENALLEEVPFQRSREYLFADLSGYLPELGLFDLPES